MALAPRRSALYALLAATLGLVAIELGFRVVAATVSPSVGDAISRYRDEWAPQSRPALRYRPHPYLVYTHDPDYDPEVNDLGFHFGDLPLDKPGGTYRVACFGGSTTAGPRAWPHHLEQQLEAELGQPVEVLNFGVGGWTSAEGAIAFTHLARSYDVDAVVLHHVNNDIRPLGLDGFRPDYAHFRKPAALDEVAGRVRVRWSLSERLDDRLTRLSSLYVYTRMWTVGPPVGRHTLSNLTYRAAKEGPPDAVRRQVETWERNLRTIGDLAELDGAQVVTMTMPAHFGDAGLPHHAADLDFMNERLRALSRDQGWRVADAANDDGFPPEVFEDPIHVTQDGEKRKAALVAAALIDALAGS